MTYCCLVKRDKQQKEVNSSDVTELIIRQVLWQMHMNTWEFLIIFYGTYNIQCKKKEIERFLLKGD